MNSIISAVLIIIIIALASYLGSSVTRSGKSWYRTIAVPSYNPPDWVFPVVWTTIYILFGFAIWRLWNHTTHDSILGLMIALIVANLVLNVSWSYIFFGFHQLWAAALVSGLLWLTIAAIMIFALPRDTLSAALLLPYLIWVGFATFLTSRIARLNQGR